MPCGKIEAFQEATQDFVAVQARAYQLDGHLLSEFAVRAHRQIHAGHTTLPHPPYDRNERQTLAGLDHPNIVKLLDGGSNRLRC